jgi:hypothetical protein
MINDARIFWEHAEPTCSNSAKCQMNLSEYAGFSQDLERMLWRGVPGEWYNLTKSDLNQRHSGAEPLSKHKLFMTGHVMHKTCGGGSEPSQSGMFMRKNQQETRKKNLSLLPIVATSRFCEAPVKVGSFSDSFFAWSHRLRDLKLTEH